MRLDPAGRALGERNRLSTPRPARPAAVLGVLRSLAAAARPFDKKRGFTVPVGEWIARRGRTLGPLVARSSGIAEACKPDAVERLFATVADHGGGRHAAAAWHLLAFALWHRRHGLGKPPVDDVAEALATAR